jgi:uncharacterized protein
MSMSKQVYINLPVRDLTISTKFYEALGFVKNPEFSNDQASGMIWSDNITIMLLTHDFYSQFTSKKIPDFTQNSSVLISLTMNSREDVQKFADVAEENGGEWFEAEPNKGMEYMFGLEVTDPDGHTLEPFFMDMNKLPVN